MTQTPEQPWMIPLHVTTICWVKTIDGRDIPLRYTDIRKPGDEHSSGVLELWPNYPANYDQVVLNVKYDQAQLQSLKDAH